MRTAALIIVLLTPTVAAAQLPPAWANWPSSAPIDVPATTAARLVSVVVPTPIWSRSVGTDLRVIDASGREVPFVVRARLGGKTSASRGVRLLDTGNVPGETPQAVLDTGDRALVHNAVKLFVSSPNDVLSWVEIATSPDARTWRVVRERAPIYRLYTQGLGENMDVSYPDSTERYVRLRLLDTSKPATIVGGQVTFEEFTVAELVQADVPLAPGQPEGARSVWLSSPNAPRSPIGEVRFETAESGFDRPLQISTTEDGERWQPLASGQIRRVANVAQGGTVLTVAVPDSQARQWRVTVYNGNDPPIADLRPVFYGTPRRVVFRQEPGVEYRLLFGNTRAPAPQYDMARLTDAKSLDAATPASLGVEVQNTGWVDPAPWTERNPVVLWLALAAAMAVIGLLALRTLAGTKAGSDGATGL